MNDKELLELAGSAAGLQVTAEYFDDGNIFAMRKNGGGWWNPLNDDGDALRLAATLRMTVDFGARKEMNMESTRRAIVQAAAEIGKSL